MMNLINSNRHLSLISIVLIIAVAGCVTTGPVKHSSTSKVKPNIPFTGRPHPIILNDLAHRNTQLVNELGKLPELQDNISKNVIQVLKKIVDTYNENPNDFDETFREMYKVGIPTVRKYCTPLQALFWLFEDDKIDLAKEFIASYELSVLLMYSWKYEKKERWENYDTVVERLNSPKLLNHYQRINFTYQTDRGSRMGDSWLFFQNKYGDCRDYTAFAVECLGRAGYEAWPIKVACYAPLKCNKFHVVCEYKENGKEYIMDNTCDYCGSGIGITEKHKYVNKYPQVGYGYTDETVRF